MSEFILANPPATIAVVFAVACQILWPFCGRRSAIILLQLGTNSGFTAHYGLLGLWAASAVSALAAVQAMAALFARGSDLARYVGYMLVPAMVAAGIILWRGPITVLAVAAMILISVGRMQSRDMPLRVLLMAGASVWAVHDLIIASYFALAGDLLSISFACWQMTCRSGPRA